MDNRIKVLRKERGWSMAALAQRICEVTPDVDHVEPATINKLEKGGPKGMRLSDVWIDRLAKAFSVNPVDILVESPPEPIHVHGYVQAGAWSESLEWEEGDRYPVWVPIPDQWRPFAKFGVEVCGPSMNRRYPEGTVLICVPIIDADIEPAEDQRYIVERTDTSGLHEMTVKELRFDRDGRPWLWPDSDDPEFQQPLAADGEDGDEVEIRAIVITSVQPE